MPATTDHGPRVVDGAVDFALTDPRLERVALVHELRRPRRIEFARAGSSFRLRFPRPPADRLEYLLELTPLRGDPELALDPTNPRTAPGPFGDKSLVELPEYARPGWLDADVPSGGLRELELPSARLGAVQALLWSPASTDEDAPLPLLVVHDGPEYARYSSLLELLDYLAAGDNPPFRALLVPPGPARNEVYSASTRYANALVRELLPAALREAPSASPLLLLGASLGALAGLHAHFTHPGVFGGLALQSGSFFRKRFDAHESGLPRFGRIARFVGQVHGRGGASPVPTLVTCGTAEENLANNEVLADALERRGWPVKRVWNRDAHNWTSWRDALHPHLAELLAALWG